MRSAKPEEGQGQEILFHTICSMQLFPTLTPLNHVGISRSRYPRCCPHLSQHFIFCDSDVKGTNLATESASAKAASTPSRTPCKYVAGMAQAWKRCCYEVRFSLTPFGHRTAAVLVRPSIVVGRLGGSRWAMTSLSTTSRLLSIWVKSLSCHVLL